MGALEGRAQVDVEWFGRGRRGVQSERGSSQPRERK